MPGEERSRAREYTHTVFERKCAETGRQKRLATSIAVASTLWGEEEFAQLEKEIQERSHVVDDEMNPLTRKSWDYVTFHWMAYFRLKVKNFNIAQLWHQTTVVHNFKAFLRWKAMSTKGRSASMKMSSRTLRGSTNVFIQLIIKYVHDDDLNKIGLRILSQQGLYHKFENRVKYRKFVSLLCRAFC